MLGDVRRFIFGAMANRQETDIEYHIEMVHNVTMYGDVRRFVFGAMANRQETVIEYHVKIVTGRFFRGAVCLSLCPFFQWSNLAILFEM